MTYNTLFFDLDGTLTDSGEGILNCAELALRHFGISIASRDDLRVFVGPPLRDTFLDFGIPQDRVEEAVDIFRERYCTTGKYENYPYSGIHDLLKELQAGGYRMFVATSKPETMALDVLEHFDLARYFECICGATMDGSRGTKEDVITYLLGQIGTVENVVMIGDTKFDVLGAAVHKIPTIGVTWGYGSEEEILASGAIAAVHSPAELLAFLAK